jgi:hypothetical protein
MRNLALPGRNSGELCYLLCHPLTAAVRADNTTLFEFGDVKILVKFFVAILAEKDVLRHGRFLPDLSSLPT